jgi:autotransporter-associated beta strand protein
VQNTSTAITLSQISGAGSFRHDGASTTTLLNNSYSGGTTINAGTVLAASANAFGTGRLTNNAGLALTAAQHELALGGFTQGAGGSLTLVIGGATAGVDNDHLTVTGSAVLGGKLTLNFTGSHAAGQKIVLVNATGGITGAFSSIVGNGASVVSGQDGTSFYVTVQ